jgi:hypothetical protein
MKLIKDFRRLNFCVGSMHVSPTTGIPLIVNGAIVVKGSEVLKVNPGRAIKGGNN